jgi:lysine 2,3-aminomutase
MKLQMTHFEQLSEHVREILRTSGNDRRLTKQFVFDPRELKNRPSDYDDVAADRSIEIVKGVYHRYPSKVLFCPTGECLGHCRFCFRKHIKKNTQLTDSETEVALAAIRENKLITEVIFSGGDPFALPAVLLTRLLQNVRGIAGVRIIRIHTRTLTYAPELITESLVECFKAVRPLFLVFHVNSHLELSAMAKAKCALLVDAGIPCFSQTALLRDVNDSTADLSALFMTLLENGVKPYYLFHTDRVQGGEHFYVKLSKGIDLYKSLYNRISGLAMPIYLFNVPGGHGHCIVDLGNIVPEKSDRYRVTDWQGNVLSYED